MPPLYVFVIYNEKSNKPRSIGIKNYDKIVILDLFHGKGSGTPLSKIFSRINKIKKLIEKSEHERPIVSSNIKQLIEAFNISFDDRMISIYDMHLPIIANSNSDLKNNKIITQVLDKMSLLKLPDYQKLLANSQIIYNKVQKRGLEIGHTRFHPIWSNDTYSGRSKSTNPNIQGWSDNDIIRTPDYSDRDVMIQFDWICADIRVASLLSKDKTLQSSFVDSDPYTTMMNVFNNSEDQLSRTECKLMLLKAINSMDYTSLAFSEVFPDLGRWIRKCKSQSSKPNGYMRSILGRKFITAHSKSELAVLNGTMQGSVAHAMHNVICNVYNRHPRQFLFDIHDSLFMNCSSNQQEIKSIISSVVPIMLRPFKNYLPDDPVFPVKVSIGRKWKKWKTYNIYRG